MSIASGPSMKSAAAALLAAAVGVGLFAPTLDYGFVWDDGATVLFNREIQSLSNVPAMFTGHAFAGARDEMREIKVVEYYRPVWTLSLAVNHAVWGKQPMGYHLTNVLLHGLASGLTAWLVLELGAGAAAAAVAATRFSAHPIHAEAVAWVSARNDVMLGVFLLLAFIAYLRFRRGGRAVAAVACLGFFVLALLSKETAVVFPAIVLLYEWGTRRRPGFAGPNSPAPGAGARGAGKSGAKGAAGVAGGAASHRPGASPAAPRPAKASPSRSTVAVPALARYGPALVLGAIAAGFLMFRGYIVAPLPVHDPLATRLASAPLIVLTYLRLLFVPAGLRVLHTFDPLTSPLSWATLAPLALLVGIAALMMPAFRLHPALGLGLGWLLIALLPVSGLPALLQPTPIAERYLYLPSIGWALAIGGLLAAAPRATTQADSAPTTPSGPRAGRWLERAATGVAIAAIPAFAVMATAHSRPWRSDIDLGTRMVADAPRSALGQSMLGLAHFRLQHWQEAANAFAQGVQLKPSEAWNHYYLACCMRRLGRLAPAERWLRNALALGMHYAPIHMELCETLGQAGRLDEAESECRKALELDPTLAEARYALARVLSLAGRSPGGPAASPPRP